jgi:uncharacterized repeat protein (TIGR01451 family)
VKDKDVQINLKETLMRKQLGVLSSLFLIGATALCWVGCSGWGSYGKNNNMAYYDSTSTYYNDASGYQNDDMMQPYAPLSAAVNGEPVSEMTDAAPDVQGCCPQPQGCCPQPMSPENCAPKDAGRRLVGSFISCDGVKVTATQPDMCLLGDQYALDIRVEAFKPVCDVEISTILPEGVTFIRSDPDARVEGSRLIWELAHMDRCQVRNIRIFLRCEREGELCTCFCVSATPVAFCAILCAKPILTCHKCGPEEACPGDMLNYTISVTNKGSCAAREVVVTDIIPQGLEHISGQNTLSFKLGDLAPCQTKSINLCLTAALRGTHCNRAIVTACNADEVSCESCVDVCRYCCEVTKEGPKEVRIGQNADYKITVTNVGDRPITQVVVTDDAPNGTSIVSANGATISGNRAVWNIESIEPSDSVNVPLVLTTCTPGFYCNKVNVHTAQNTCCAAEASTRWRGTPALNVCIVDMEDPICVGEMTSYRITVVNQGSEPDRNVRVTVRFPAEIAPVSAMGASPGQVAGQTVTFAPLAMLNPRQTVEYRIDGRAKSQGDARVKVELVADSISTPIVEEESTIVN